jgi:hypothetical protein
MRLYERAPDTARAAASAFNPKVAGSIPARPIASERNRDSERQTIQSVRKITKAGITRRIPRSPPALERLTARYADLVPHRVWSLGQHDVNNRIRRIVLGRCPQRRVGVAF